MSLSTRVKRRKNIRDEFVEQDALIFKLPDETLLTIFKYFTIEELILAAGICKWFRNIAYDDELWTTIDLSTKSYSNRILLKFFRRFPRDCTEILKISGQSSHTSSGRPPPFTDQICSLIRQSYPNLNSLHITQYDFHPNQTTVNNITCLPTNLHGLYLNKCEMLTRNFCNTLTFLELPKTLLKNSTTNFTLQQLEVFSFENSSCLIADSIKFLPDLCPKLIELNLNGCFRITSTNVFLNTILSYSNTLRRLYLSETQITDDTMHTICRKLKRLNILDIKKCRNVTKNIVENLLTLKQLEKLIANDDIETLYNQAKNSPKND